MKKSRSILSDISFEDFSKEVEPLKFNNKKDVVLGLLNSYNGLNAKQEQKLVFLSMVENNIIFPFNFKKNQYGPYSQDLEIVTKELNDEKIVNIKIKSFTGENGKTYNPEERSLTKIGKNITSKDIVKLSKIFSDVISKYEKGNELSNAAGLESHCYETYYLTKEETEEWRNSVKSKIYDVLSLLENRLQTIEEKKDLEEKGDLILMAFDYMKNLLNEILDKKIDQVVRGVLIKKAEEYIEKWGEILLLDKSEGTMEEFNKILSEEKKLFKFINNWAAFNNVCDSIFEFELEEK